MDCLEVPQFSGLENRHAPGNKGWSVIFSFAISENPRGLSGGGGRTGENWGTSKVFIGLIKEAGCAIMATKSFDHEKVGK